VRIDLTKIQVAAIVAEMRVRFPEDEQFLLDTLEGQTDLFEIVGKLLDGIEYDDGQAAALISQIEARNIRLERAKARKAVRRDAIQSLMDAAGRDRLTLPEATLSVRRLAPKPTVTDAEAVPRHLCRVKHTPDMAAIKAEMEAGSAVPGVELSNGGASLTIRRS
jgi:hypothetical protein